MDELSVEDLFANLKQTVSEENTNVTDPKKTASSDDLQDDKVSVEDDDRAEQFHAIEKSLKRLPKLQTGFDQLGLEAADKNGKVTKVDDPIYILESRKKSGKVKPPTATEQWFTLPKPEMTAEIKRDLMLIKHRAALDPKRHYKKEKWQTPERFSVGTIVEGPTEFHSRMKNRERKNTMLETLMLDDSTNKYFKRKYTEVQQKKTSGRKQHYKTVKDRRHRL